ncbi:hypothetical protein L484_007584 [Morus notabilis]|uniref:Secreted protein n=1 Tax=Morus notabilis TaxID=981085 RepID=W9QM27_9ROSA|nr:hypothetical protein L484_007584 [Morus notabilis]
MNSSLQSVLFLLWARVDSSCGSNGARLLTRGADRESHKGTLNVILEGRYHNNKKSESWQFK